MKYILSGFVLIYIALLSACGQGDPPAPGFGEGDMHLYINGKVYGLNISIDKVIEDFGSGYGYAEARSCDYDGLDKTFLYETAEFYTFPLKDGDMVSEIYSASPEASTSRGIKIGAPREDVLAAYGEDCEDDGWQIIYAIDGGSLCFDLEDGVVTGFYITVRAL